MRAVGTTVRGRALTWANALTLLRGLAAPLLAAAVLTSAPRAAGLLFALAVATDFADGWVARRREESSAFGGFLDHATDAAFVTLGLAALASLGVVPAPLPVLIVVAFAQYAFDSRAFAGSALRPSALGRWNGIAYYVMLGIPVVRDALGLSWPGPLLVLSLGWVLVLSTAASIADRAQSLWRVHRARRG